MGSRKMFLGCHFCMMSARAIRASSGGMMSTSPGVTEACEQDRLAARVNQTNNQCYQTDFGIPRRPS